MFNYTDEISELMKRTEEEFKAKKVEEKIQKEHMKYCDTEICSKINNSDPSLGNGMGDSKVTSKSQYNNDSDPNLHQPNGKFLTNSSIKYEPQNTLSNNSKKSYIGITEGMGESLSKSNNSEKDYLSFGVKQNINKELMVHSTSNQSRLKENKSKSKNTSENSVKSKVSEFYDKHSRLNKSKISNQSEGLRKSEEQSLDDCDVCSLKNSGINVSTMSEKDPNFKTWQELEERRYIAHNKQFMKGNTRDQSGNLHKHPMNGIFFDKEFTKEQYTRIEKASRHCEACANNFALIIEEVKKARG